MSHEILQLHHVSFIVADIECAKTFYCDVLGFNIDHSRPDLGYPGLWLEINGVPQVHLMQLPNPDATKRPEHGGRDRHAAFKVTSIESLAERLDEAGVTYTKSRSGRAALFCRDPDQNALEFMAG